MSKRRAWLASLFLLTWPICAAAEQSGKIPPPTAPLVAQPLPGTSCTITVEDPTAFRKLTGIEYLWGKGATKIVATWSGGTSTEGYIIGGQLLQKLSSGRVSVTTEQSANLTAPVFVQGYPGSAWPELADYKGVERIAEQDCYKFQRAAAVVLIDGVEVGVPELSAWVRVSDKVPVRMSFGNVVYEFSPIQAGPSAIDIPTEYRSVAEKAAKERAALNFLQKMNQKP